LKFFANHFSNPIFIGMIIVIYLNSDAILFAKSDLHLCLIFPAFDNAMLLSRRALANSFIIEGNMEIIRKLFRQSAFLLGVGLTLHASSSFAARCEYVVQNEWGTGFVAAIRITNDTSTAINGWSVNWAYTDGSKRTGGWNANFSGNNPYKATSVGWNDRINPGKSIEIGVQGDKGVANKPAQRPVVTGGVCSGSSSLPSSSIRSSSSLPSSSSSVFVQSSTSMSRTSSSSSLPLPSSSSRTSSSYYSWSSSSSSRISSSSSISSGPNTAPVADIQLSIYGLTVQVSGRESTDADGHSLQYTIDYGDGSSIKYPEAWHTYKQAGEYNITLTASDGIAQSITSQVVNVEPAPGNQAPIARLTVVREYTSLLGRATSSYDEQNAPLTYEWDFGDGAFPDGAFASVSDCDGRGDTTRRSRLVTVTVSDGELKDTRQGTFGGLCGSVYDVLPIPQFTYRVVGNQLFVDGSTSLYETGFQWNFGDGSIATGLLATHTYAAPGTYEVILRVSGPSLFGNAITKVVVVGDVSSGSSSAHSLVASSSSVASAVSASYVSTSAIYIPCSSRSSIQSSLVSSCGYYPLPSSSSSSSSSLASVTSSSSSYPAGWSSRSTSSKRLSSSSSSISSGPNTAPVANLQVTEHGLTVQASGSASVDADGHKLQYTIDFGDGKTIKYPEAWHTYKQAGVYTVTLTVSDGITQDTQSQLVNVQAIAGNKAPIARMSISLHSGGQAFGSSSYDYEGARLTYEWDYGDGSFPDDSGITIGGCPDNHGVSRLVTMTVSDGQFKDTTQRSFTQTCERPVDNLPVPRFSYVVEGNTILVDGSDSYLDTGFRWNFGDGTIAEGLFASHTYEGPGIYDVNLYVSGADMFGASTTKQVVIGGSSSSAASSASGQ
jgi:PKD repeat protein